jgi:hypothetical protein
MDCKIPKKKSTIAIPKKQLVILPQKKIFVPRKLVDIADRVAKRKEAIPLDKIDFPSDYRLGVTGITQTIFETFLRCRQCFKLTLNRYEPVGARNITAFGSLVHYCLDKIYSYTIANRGAIPTEEMNREWIQDFRLNCRDDFKNIREADVEILVGIAFIILCEYVLYYKEDFKEKHWEAVEQTSESMFFGSKLRRKVDGKYRIAGKKWLMETKTMSRIELDSLLLKLTFDFQNLFYVTCEELNEPDDPVEGVLYNIIRNPSSKPHAGESLQEFLQRLRGEIAKNRKHYFMRYEIPYTIKDKMQFKQELEQQLEEMAHVLVGIMPVYKNPFACVGRFTCDFLPACSSGKLTGYVKRKSLFPELDLEA